MTEETKKGGAEGDRPFGVHALDELSFLHHMEEADVLAHLDAGSVRGDQKPLTAIPTGEKKKALKRVKRGVVKRTLSEDEQRERRLRKQREIEQEAARQVGILNLLDVPEEMRAQFVQRLESEHKRLMRYVMLNVAPIELSIDPAIADVQEALKILTSAQDIEIQTTKIKQALHEMVDLKIVHYLSRRLKIDPTLLELVLARNYGVKDERLSFLHKLSELRQPQKDDRVQLQAVQEVKAAKPANATVSRSTVRRRPA